MILAEPRPQPVAVQVDLPEGRGRQALTKALGVLTGVTDASPGHVAFVSAADLDQAHQSGVWRVAFGRPPPRWLVDGEARDFVGPFILEKRHPLLYGVTLGGVVWSGVMPLSQGLVRPLVSTTDRILVGTAIESASGDAGTRILFNLDLDRTNLIRAPDWPILISNLIEVRRNSLPGPERWNYRTGEWIRVRLEREATAPSFRCGSIERALPIGRQLEFIAPAPCGLLQVLENGQPLFELGVNFLDETETRLRGQTTADNGALNDTAGMRAETTAASDPLFWILLATAAIAVMTNWVLLPHRPIRA